MNFTEIRQKYKTFTYEYCKLTDKTDFLEIEFGFSIEGLTSFTPKTKLYYKGSLPALTDLYYFAVNLGMVEAISYYKAVLAEKIIIKPSFFDSEQLKFWKKLYYKGLGEFFYVNNIDSKRNLFEFECISNQNPKVLNAENNAGILVPIGGGKDSVVSIELLKTEKANPFVLNPSPAIMRCVEISGIKTFYKAERTICKNLLELNKKGFLNGHTPFSAMLAFLASFVAYINGKKYIALSNESSANEGNIEGTDVNHQYSKSYEFEQDFRTYLNKYVVKGIEYFSFLRPLSELAIAALFSQFKQYHKAFRSCNKGSKTDIWCAACPKCMFVYIILSPFLTETELIAIFGKNILNDLSNELIFKQLTGLEKVKPLECVGTRQEVIAALLKAYKGKKSKPKLVEKYLSKLNSDFDYKKHYDENHNLNKTFEDILKKALCKI